MRKARLFGLVSGPVSPDEMQQAIIAVRKMNGALCGTWLYNIGTFPSEGPSSFESEENFSHWWG